MSLTESDHIEAAARPTCGQVILFAIATGLSLAAAVGLTLSLDASWKQTAFLPLLVSGLFLIAWNTHWALCFAAFAITPFGVVQVELLGVTLNLPEVLILALVAKEGYLFLTRRERFSPRFPLRTLALFFLAAAVAIVTGVLYQNGLLRVLQDCRQFTEFLVLFWLVIHRVPGRDEALRIAFCYVIGATLLALHGIAQQVVPVGILPTQISSDLDLYRGVRSTSFYGATTLGGIMVLAMAPAAGVLLSSKHRATRTIMALCMFLCAVAIIYTRTRASWIGLVVALGLIALSIRPTPRLIASALGATALLGLLLGPLVVQRLYTLTDPREDESIIARVQYYAAAARIAQEHPLFGLGWGPFYEINTLLGIEPYVAPALDESLAAEPVEEPEEEATVHSAYLQLLVKTGLFGVVAFAGILTVWLARIWAARHIRFRGDSDHGLFVGITAGLVGYLLHCTFENFFQWPVMAQSFWLLLGLSFLLAPGGAERVPRFRVPLAFTGCAALAFLIFMAVCVQLEKAHPNHYLRNVARALEKGESAQALEIARRATVARWNEPMPYTVHARLLLAHGEDEAALAELAKSVDAAERPRALRRQRNTGLYYYFAPARLTWGQYFAARGAHDQALQQFELARAYADLRAPEYAEFHEVLYAAYAARGRWGRALEFGRPDAAEISELSVPSLRALAEAASAGDDQALAESAVAALQARGASPLAQTEFPALRYARAWRGADTSAQAPLLEAFRAAIAAMEPVSTVSDANADGLRPLAWSMDSNQLASDAAVSALVLWGRGALDWSGLSGLAFPKGPEGNTVHLEGTDLVLQLHRADNLVDWASVEQAQATDTVLPGWIDSARDWFDLREGPSAPIYPADGNARALTLDRLAWYFSVPAPVAEGKNYLVAGRVLDRDGGARLSWQFINAGNMVVQSGALHDGAPTGDWIPVSACLPFSDPGHHALRLAVELLRPIGHGVFDDLLLLELEAPESSTEQAAP